MSETDTTVPVHDGPVDCSPREAGYDPERLNLLDTHFSALIGNGRLQGASYLLTRKGKVFAHRALGWRTPDRTAGALETGHLRMVASVTKMFTATAIMQLVEAGRLAIETPVSAFVPEFGNKAHQGITVKHLLTHTAGIAPDPGSQGEAWPVDWPLEAIVWGNDNPPPAPDADGNPPGPDELVSRAYRKLLSGPPLRAPGQEWMYCSAGFCVLADIVRRVSGQSYPAYVTDHILAPLGMADSTFNPGASMENRMCLVEPDDRWILQPQPEDARLMLHGGGGLVSTLADMSRFAMALCAGGSLRDCPSALADSARAHPGGCRILGRRTIEYMARNHLDRVPSNAWGGHQDSMPYGLGFTCIHADSLCSPGTFGHEGAGRCVLLVDPAEEFTAFWYVPTAEPWVAESIRHPRFLIWSGIL